ncbi:MAG TPA: serine/threonine protein kinase, partial [Planctomycetota bacterium]|nr:serine/threonine protein kinase [Planctomycetota bacterium]
MQPGERLLHYRLVRPLGRGGMGEVWLARDEQLERDVALKFLHPWNELDEESRARLVREARAASALRHPSMLTVHAIESLRDGRTFLVL